MQESKLVILTDTSGYGGSEKSLMRMLGYLLNNSISFSMIISDNYPIELEEFIKKNKIISNALKAGNTIRSICRHFLFFISRMFFQKNTVYLIWCHHLDSNRWIQFFLAITRQNFIIVERLVPTDLGFAKKSKLTVPLKKYIAKKARKIILCAHSQVKNYQEWFEVKDIDVILNARDVGKIVGEVKLCKEITIESSTSYTILSVGRLTDQKNHLGTIEALTFIEACDVKLFIVGDGPCLLELKEIIKNNQLEEKVFLEGHQDNPFKYYASCNLFILNSIYEGLPGVLIEAMASRVPCIATDIPGNRDLVIDGITGKLIQVNSPEKLAEAIQWMKDNEIEARRLASNAYEHVLRNFDNSVEEQRWIELFQTG